MIYAFEMDFSEYAGACQVCKRTVFRAKGRISKVSGVTVKGCVKLESLDRIEEMQRKKTKGARKSKFLKISL